MTQATDQQAPTPEAMAFVGKVIDNASGMMAIRLCAIGDRLGLFKDLAENGPATSVALAARTGLNERYLREWIYGMFLGGYLNFDKQSREVSMPEAHIPALVDVGGPLFQGGLFKMFTGFMEPYEDLIEAFQQGGGIAYESYPDDFWKGLEHNSCVRYKNLLVSQWLPEMPDVQAKLENGGTFADFGCGAGRSSIELAKAYPKARFYGFDLFPQNIENARKTAEEEGVSDRVEFQVHDISKGVPGKFDVVATFDLIHDMADPKGGLKALRQACKDDGIYVLMDVDCTDDPADNQGPLALFKLGASLHFCMTTSLGQGGMGLGTVGLPESKVVEFSSEAGFSTVRRLPIEHPLNALYEIRP
ncbi:MAG: methyltransferase domain-containing protein [Gammaproteobacteria bacterium]|nr:methyltransferase domain-containing protein [Gammaproteobacteria bacterium]MBQ0838379.1 methyltransferase domain-containing protein [Gammaproteobacteria bacterium]